jgi:hypothetical protein
MPDRISVPVRAGKVERVTVRRVKEPAAAKKHRTAAVPRGRHAPAPTYGHLATRFEHLGARLTTSPRPGTADPAHDRRNGWEARTFEVGPFPSFAEAVRENGEFLKVAAPVEPPLAYLYSERPIDGQGMPLGAHEATTDYGLTFGLARVRDEGEDPGAPRPDRLYPLDHTLENARPMRSAAEALADWDALEPIFAASPDPGALARWRAGREVVERRQQETFDASSSRFAGRDMTLEAAELGPGLYVPRFNGVDQFHPWSAEDPALYDVGRVLPSGERRAAAVHLAVGRRQSTAMTCRLVPRRHQYIFAWTAIYLAMVAFTVPVYITEINLGAYADILPLDWRAVSSENDGRNDVAMSNRILRSRRYAVAIRQDFGSQVFSPYYVKILVGRQDGQWAVRRGVMRAGELAAVLDVDRGGYQRFSAPNEGQRERYTIYRKTTVQGGQRMNYGRLFTDQVYPYPDSGISVWSRAHVFGAL